jgi:translation initiation factor IF-3
VEVCTITRVNNQIRARKVRVIGVDNEQVGIMLIRDALKYAVEHKLDLVEVAPNADPPVCRIMDYGKFKYEQSKREQKAKKNQNKVEVKELKFKIDIGEHDYQFKMRHAREFLEDSNKVKARVIFRGREIVHSELGREMLERLADDLSDLGEVERKPFMEGHSMLMIVGPKSDK